MLIANCIVTICLLNLWYWFSIYSFPGLSMHIQLFKLIWQSLFYVVWQYCLYLHIIFENFIKQFCLNKFGIYYGYRCIYMVEQNFSFIDKIPIITDKEEVMCGKVRAEYWQASSWNNWIWMDHQFIQVKLCILVLWIIKLLIQMW